MSGSIRDPHRTLVDRYRDHRTRRFLKHERTWSSALPGWRSRHRRRLLVGALALTLAVMFGISVLCAVGFRWAPLAVAAGVRGVPPTVVGAPDRFRTPG